MAATTLGNRAGKVAIIVTSETNQIAGTAGSILRKVIVNNVSASATLDIYDNNTTNLNKIFEWVTADGKVVRDLDIPIQNGIRVVTAGGTTPNIVLVYE